jgi:hypothetical protein
MSRERDEFVAFLALNRALPFTASAIAARAARIMRLGAEYKRIMEAAWYWTQTPSKAARLPKIEREIEEMVGQFGAKAEFGVDPCDYTVRMVIPQGKSNRYAGTSWGIPNS